MNKTKVLFLAIFSMLILTGAYAEEKKWRVEYQSGGGSGELKTTTSFGSYTRTLDSTTTQALSLVKYFANSDQGRFGYAFELNSSKTSSTTGLYSFLVGFDIGLKPHTPIMLNEVKIKPYYQLQLLASSAMYATGTSSQSGNGFNIPIGVGVEISDLLGFVDFIVGVEYDLINYAFTYNKILTNDVNNRNFMFTIGVIF